MANKSKDENFGSECSGSIGGTVMFLTSEGLRGEYVPDKPEDTGMIGTDKPAVTGIQFKKIDVKGTLVVRPSYAHMNVILQQWFDEAAGTFTPADDPNGKTSAAVIDRGVDIYTYAANWLAQMEVRFTENEPIDVALDLLGTTEADSGSVAALVPPVRMMCDDLVIAANANTYFPVSGLFRFGYAYDPAEGRFHQSQTRSSVASRIPFAEVEMTLDENADNWADIQALAGTITVIDDVVLTFTGAAGSLTINMWETINVTPSRWPESSGVGPRQHTITLRATLDAAQSDICNLVYTT